jgi:Zn finger protein HypA/HybF involved in hydrogenase expression
VKIFNNAKMVAEERMKDIVRRADYRCPRCDGGPLELMGIRRDNGLIVLQCPACKSNFQETRSPEELLIEASQRAEMAGGR